MLLPGREESEGQACITHIYTAASLLLSSSAQTFTQGGISSNHNHLRYGSLPGGKYQETLFQIRRHFLNR